MPFPSINPGQAAALTASHIQHPSLDPTQPQAMYTLNNQYLRAYIGGNDNLIWSNSGLTYDSTRNKILSVCNGGHADSGDNSVYELDLGGTQTWSRVFNATFGFGGVGTPGDLIPSIAPGIASVYTDTLGHYGTAGNKYPAARHSYMGNIYMPSNGQVWLAGGIHWEQVGSTSSEIWWYDPVAHTFALQADIFPGGGGASAAWDPHLERVYFHSGNFLRYYDPALPPGARIQPVSGDAGDWTSASMSACFDWKRRRYVMLGWNSSFGGANLYYFDLMANPESTTRVIQSLTAGGFPGVDVTVPFPGLLYDIIRDKYIVSLGATTFAPGPVYGGSANTLWSIDPDTFVSTPLIFTGDPVALRSINTPGSNLIHNIADDVYIYLSTHRQNQYAFRHPDQHRSYAIANRSFVSAPRWALGAGPAGIDPATGSNITKHGRPFMDTTRELAVHVGGDVQKFIDLPGVSNGANNSEIWLYDVTQRVAATRLEKATDVPSAYGGIVAGWPDNVSAGYDSVNDRYILMGGTNMHGAGFAMRDPITSATATGFTLTVTPPPDPTSYTSINASPYLYCFVQGLTGDVGGQQEILHWDTSDLPAGTFHIDARGQFGTTPRTFPAGALAIALASSGYQKYVPFGPIPRFSTDERGDAYTFDPTTRIWTFQTGIWTGPGATGGFGHEGTSCFGEFDHHPTGTKSFFRLSALPWGLTLERWRMTANPPVYTGYPITGTLRDGILSGGFPKPAIDTYGRYIYGVRFIGLPPMLYKIALTGLTEDTNLFRPGIEVSLLPASFDTTLVGEVWAFFDPLNRIVIIPNNVGQFNGPTFNVYLYHVDHPTRVYASAPANPGWEVEAIAGGSYGNQGVLDHFRNVLWWGYRSANGQDDRLYRYYGGPTIASAAVLALSSLNPSSGLAGAACTLSGTLFGASQGTSSVKFGPGSATPSTWSDTTIRITIPSLAAGTYNVSVTVGSSTSNTLPFTIVTNAPTITSVSPPSGPVLSTVTITGTNFGLNQLVSTLTIGGAFATVLSWADTQVLATVPASLGIGVQAVVLTTVNGSASSSFTVTPPAPTADLVFDGLLRDRVGPGNTSLAPDGALDGTFTVTGHRASGMTVTGLQLAMLNSVGTSIGVWDTLSSSVFWVLGAALSLDGTLLNNPVSMGVSFTINDGNSFKIFASDLAGTEFLNGNVATLTVTYSDSSTSTTTITLGAPPPPPPPPPSGTVSITLLPYGLGNF